MISIVASGFWAQLSGLWVPRDCGQMMIISRCHSNDKSHDIHLTESIFVFYVDVARRKVIFLKSSRKIDHTVNP
jgi:hypothetical protein